MSHAVFSQQLDNAAVDNQRIEEEGQIQRNEYGAQGKDGLRPVGVHHGGDRAEHAHRRKQHDHRDDLHRDFIDRVCQRHKRIGLFSQCQAGDANDDGKHQHLQHIPVGKGGHRIGGNQIFYRIQQTGELCGRHIGLHHLDGHPPAKAQHLRQEQPQQTGKQGGSGVVDDRLGADPSGGGDAADAVDACHQGAEHQGIDHHAQSVHVQSADQVDNRQQAFQTSWNQQSQDDAQDQPDEDRQGKVGGFFLFHRKQLLYTEHTDMVPGPAGATKNARPLP